MYRVTATRASPGLRAEAPGGASSRLGAYQRNGLTSGLRPVGHPPIMGAAFGSTALIGG